MGSDHFFICSETKEEGFSRRRILWN